MCTIASRIVLTKIPFLFIIVDCSRELFAQVESTEACLMRVVFNRF